MPNPEIPREPVDARALPWKRLLEFLPALSAPESDPGEWRWPEVLSRFVGTLYNEGFIVAFDWPGWTQGEGRRLVEDPSALATAGLDDLYRLLTAHVRQDRFAEGHLLAEYRSGTLAAILLRANELIDDQLPDGR